MIHETDGTCLITVIDWWKTHALLTLTLPCLVRLRNFFLSSSHSWRMLSSNFCGSWNSTYFLPAHSVPSQPLFLNLSSTIIGTISLFCSFAYCPSTHTHHIHTLICKALQRARPSVPCLRFSRNRNKAVQTSNLVEIWPWTRVTRGAKFEI